MNPYAVMPLLGSVVALFLGTFVYLQDRTAPSNRLFLVVCLSMTFLSFDMFVYRQVDSEDVAWAWIRLGGLWPISDALIFHYALVFTGTLKSRLSRVATGGVYLTAIALAGVYVFTTAIWEGPVMRQWGWAPQTAYGSVGVLISAVWTVTVVVATISVVYVQRARSSDRRFRAQAKYLLLAYTIPVTTIVVVAVALPLAGIPAPDISTQIFPIGMGLLAYGLIKNQLFVLTPRAVSQEILETMSDAVLLVDTRRLVASVNSSALRLIGLDRDSIVGQPLGRFLSGATPGAPSRDVSGLEGGTEEGRTGRTINGDTVQRQLRGDTVLTTGAGRHLDVSVAAATLQSSEGEALGTVVVARDISERKEMEATVLRLEEQRRQQALKEAKEEERKRLAEELHDQTLQELTGLAIEVSFIEREAAGQESAEAMLRGLRARIHGTETGLRDILKGLYPDVLTNLGLVAALRSFFEGLTTQRTMGDSPVKILFSARGFGDQRPPDLAEITAYRLVQQSVFNAVQHGRPSEVNVELAWDAVGLSIEVHDDGVGFTPTATTRLRSTGHHGIANLYDRLEAAGGQIEVHSAPGDGTHVTGRIPVDEQRFATGSLETAVFQIEPKA